MPRIAIVGLALLALIAVFVALIVGERPDNPPVVTLELPDWRECLQDYENDVVVMIDAVEAGDTQAVRCDLALNEIRSMLPSEYFKLYYTIYRVEGVEPDGLDAVVRGMDRQSLASHLQDMHDFSPWLEPVPQHWLTACPHYDPLARELLLRSIPSKDMWCLPRGQR